MTAKEAKRIAEASHRSFDIFQTISEKALQGWKKVYVNRDKIAKATIPELKARGYTVRELRDKSTENITHYSIEWDKA